MSDIKYASRNRWNEILMSCCGLSDRETTPTKKGMPCPHCGGVDRYEFKSAETGFYMCRGCGAGDGFSMIMKIHQCDFLTAKKMVEDYLNIGYCNPNKYMESDIKIIKKQNCGNGKLNNQAKRIWDKSPLADSNHPYLLRKKLPPHYFKQKNQSLIVPLYSVVSGKEKTLSANIENIQFIDDDGKKRFLRGAKVKACFTPFLVHDSKKIYFCEGVADAIGTSIMHNQTAICCYNAANIGLVAKKLRPHLHDREFVLFIDNDRPQPNRKYRAGAVAIHYHKYFDFIEIPPIGEDPSDCYITWLQKSSIYPN